MRIISLEEKEEVRQGFIKLILQKVLHTLQDSKLDELFDMVTGNEPFGQYHSFKIDDEFIPEIVKTYKKDILGED